MKKSMSEYIKALTDNDFSILEELIQCKYRKFVKFYWMIKEHSDMISDISYNSNQIENHDVLLINLKVSDKYIDKLYSKIEKRASENEDNEVNVDMNKSKGIIYIELYGNESELP